jgi:hypothetical protein
MNTWISTPQSSNIEKFRYDNQTRILTVVFNNGGTYNYYDVPENVFTGMKSAESKGSYLSANVKKKYRYARQ